MYRKIVSKRNVRLVASGIKTHKVEIDKEVYYLDSRLWRKLEQLAGPHIALWFDNKGRLVTVTSLQWRPVDNIELVNIILELLGDNVEVVTKRVDDVELELLVRLEDVRIPELGYYTIAVHNVNDGSHALRIFNGFTVSDCSNIVFVGSRIFKRRIIHYVDRVNIHRLELILQTDITRNVLRFIRLHEDLSRVVLDTNIALAILEYSKTKNILTRYIVEDVVERVVDEYRDNYLTLWDLLMSVTYVTTRSNRFWSCFDRALTRLVKFVHLLDSYAVKYRDGVVYAVA